MTSDKLEDSDLLSVIEVLEHRSEQDFPHTSTSLSRRFKAMLYSVVGDAKSKFIILFRYNQINLQQNMNCS